MMLVISSYSHIPCRAFSRAPGPVLALALLLLTSTACSVGQSGFVRTASDAGSELTAAETTLLYVHQGKLTPQYARASFMGFQSALGGVAQELPSLDGAPPPGEVQRLIKLLQRAQPALQHPCVEGSCDWRSQLRALHLAGKAFLRASGT